MNFASEEQLGISHGVCAASRTARDGSWYQIVRMVGLRGSTLGIAYPFSTPPNKQTKTHSATGARSVWWWPPMESNAGESARQHVETLANTLEQLRGHSHGVLQPLPFPTGEPGPDASTVRAHLQQLHECTAALLASARAASQECEQLRRLPPPPPIGSDELAAQRAELEDLRAGDEVLRRQIGALVFEKGRLNGTLQRREEEMRSLGEEKAAVVAALSAALRRVTEERDLAVRAERRARRAEPAAGGAGKRGQGSSSEMAISPEMIASQKRTIEGLRKARRQPLALTLTLPTGH